MDKITLDAYRREFPITQNYIYLDHAGISPISLRVKDAVEKFLLEAAGGAAFHYSTWVQRIVDVRRACAQLVASDPDEIAFIKSTSHGLALVAEGLDWKPGDNLLVYEKEFPSNLFPWLNLRRKGVEIRYIPSQNNRLQVRDIKRLMDARTRLLAISSVQFTTGFRSDLRTVGELCRSKNVLFCVDAIQSLGVIPMDVQAFKIDFLSADAHKWLLGPEGVGLFYCRKELTELLSPPLVGWKSVQNEFAFEQPDFRLKTSALRFEEGSLNLLGIFGLGAAIDLLLEIGIASVETRVLDLGELIIQEAEKRGYTILTPKARKERGGNITFAGPFDPLQVKDALRNRNIMINVRGGGLRVSPHYYNSEEDILKLFTSIDDILVRR
jgi:cysteine desulfurase / selenocysteine lyase